MKCTSPQKFNGFDGLPCGKCFSCKINRVSEWRTRLELEASQVPFGESLFWTGTFADEHLPAGGSVCPRSHTLFIKRLRKALAPRRFRFYGCHEYGDNTERAHCHYLFFGIPYYLEEVISQAWGLGKCHMGVADPGAIAYVAGYVARKTVKRGQQRPDGRTPEFHRMSRRPAIGAAAVPALVAQLQGPALGASFDKFGDLPPTIRYNGKQHLPGRTLRRKMREAVGLPPGQPPEAALRRQVERQVKEAVVGAENLRAREKREREAIRLRAKQLTERRKRRRSF